MSQHNNLEKLVIAHCASMVLGELEGQTCWYECYTHFRDCVKQGVEPDVSAWEGLEHWPNADLLDHIESESASMLKAVESILDLAKAGIIESAINDQLDSDMNALDLKYMIELGAELEKSV